LSVMPIAHTREQCEISRRHCSRINSCNIAQHNVAVGFHKLNMSNINRDRRATRRTVQYTVDSIDTQMADSQGPI